jgi:CYTH domain-containing protein
MPKRKLPIRPKVIKPVKKTKTGREIERRFLLKGLPKIASKVDPIHITQYYIDQRAGRIRIRESHQTKKTSVKSGNYESEKVFVNRTSKYDITKKVRIRDGVYDETITWINESKYKKLVPKAHKMISKLRYEIPCTMQGKKLKWEIDVFKSPLHMIIVEIEIPKEGFRIKMPKYLKDLIVMEITSIKEMTNYALAEQL